jgi:hypothetical protein
MLIGKSSLVSVTQVGFVLLGLLSFAPMGSWAGVAPAILNSQLASLKNCEQALGTRANESDDSISDAHLIWSLPIAPDTQVYAQTLLRFSAVRGDNYRFMRSDYRLESLVNGQVEGRSMGRNSGGKKVFIGIGRDLFGKHLATELHLESRLEKRDPGYPLVDYEIRLTDRSGKVLFSKCYYQPQAASAFVFVLMRFSDPSEVAVQPDAALIALAGEGGYNGPDLSGESVPLTSDRATSEAELKRALTVCNLRAVKKIGSIALGQGIEASAVREEVLTTELLSSGNVNLRARLELGGEPYLVSFLTGRDLFNEGSKGVEIAFHSRGASLRLKSREAAPYFTYDLASEPGETNASQRYVTNLKLRYPSDYGSKVPLFDRATGKSADLFLNEEELVGCYLSELQES